MHAYPSIGIQIPRVFLPRQGIDLTRWSVVACDQFTSQPEYWQQVATLVGDAPSTYHMILPEVFLGQPEETARLSSIQKTMRRYLAEDLLVPREGLILVERTAAGRTRHGLMLALDLEQYDYHPGSQSLIRATEGTILERLPPRIKIRQGAPLEVPHILVLIDDPAFTVIEPLFAQKSNLECIYDFDLMLGSGHLTGYFTNKPSSVRQLVRALEKLADARSFQARYGVGPEKGTLLFAMGDGNHSFATAKAIWEQIKASVPSDHPARYALVEIENIHDEGLQFEPIHRVLFRVRESLLDAVHRYWSEWAIFTPCDQAVEMFRRVDSQSEGGQSIGMISSSGYGVITLTKPTSTLPVGSFQPFLDQWERAGGFERIDYVHGREVVASLGSQPGNLGFYLPAMPKGDLFKTVIIDGVLPRKTFSMGEAIEKRFYLECRKITL